MKDFSNTFSTEPTINCPKCNSILHTDFVDNGFGPYAVQVSPYYCESCNWVETGCPADSCIKEQCFSWEKCQGKSLIIEE